MYTRRFSRWSTCNLCKQEYHGVVACALGWACWKTYLGRPETDWPRRLAISVLGNGLYGVKHHEDALSVGEAELSMLRRLGASEESKLVVQTNLASTYSRLGRKEQALRIEKDVYSGQLKLFGEEHLNTLASALNYANSLSKLKHYKEARSVLRKMMPVSQRFLGDDHEFTLKMRSVYAHSLYSNQGATLDDLREAVTTIEEIEPTARRVLGGVHPLTVSIGEALRDARAKLRARETPPSSA